MTYVSGGLGAALALMHTHTYGEGSLGSHALPHPREAALALMHSHPREAALAPHAPHAHARCLWAGWRGLTWLDGGGKGYGYNSIKTELLLYI